MSYRKNFYTSGQLLEEGYYITVNGEELLHREDGPAYIMYYEDGTKGREQYFVYGDFHREDGPAATIWFEDGKLSAEKYFVNGLFHRLDGPAEIYYFENGDVEDEIYYLNGKEVKTTSLKEFKKIVKLLAFK